MLAPQCIRTFFVTAVTWQRRSIFRSERVAELFLDTLQNYRAQHKFLLHEFVLIPDHFHLLLTPAPDVSIEKAVQLIKGGFSFRVKKDLGLGLEVWEKGYTEHRVKDSTDYQNHVDYIHQNPVRAGLAETGSDYAYGSAFCTADVDSTPPWLKPISEAALVSPR